VKQLYSKPIKKENCGYLENNKEIEFMANKFILVFPLLISLLVFGCEKSVDTSDTGILSIKLTDAPFPIDVVSEANVKIGKIEVRKAQSESEGNPFRILSEEDSVYNLLDLQNGITTELVEIEVPTGDYDLVRLYVDSAGIILKDETEYSLKVPSGSETGIKIFIDPPLTVVGGLTTELVLDFDVSQSFKVQGNPYTPAGINGFIFTPVIHATNASETGSVEGYVKDSEENFLEDAEVWIEVNNSVISKSFTEGDPNKGYYMLSNIPAGTYTVNATKNTDTEYDTVSVENVTVVAGNKTLLDPIMLNQK
jgi:hypothetical protein